MRSLRGRLLGGRYRLSEKIGSGGMGTVFRASDRKNGATVAVKLLHPHLSSDASYIARFQREVEITQSIVSPHVIAVLDFGEDGEDHFIVMEYVDGISLKRRLEMDGTLPLSEALFVTDQVAQALEEAHAKGIVHRDVKPENIMVAPDGCVKVGDFGIARAQDYAQLTVSGSVFGTVQYMAPELLTGHGDARSDLYSLGVVLYQMLAGAPPFEAPTPWEVMRKHREEEAPSVADAIPVADTGADAVVQRCLMKDPVKRFQSASDLRRAIEQCNATEEDVHPRRNRAWQLARRARRAPQRITRARPRPRRRMGLPRIAVAIVGVLALSGVALAVGLNRWPGASGTSGGEPTAASADILRISGHDFIPPNGWTLDDWRISFDGKYAVVKTRGFARSARYLPGGSSRLTAVSVYRVDPDGLVEVARMLDPGDIALPSGLPAGLPYTPGGPFNGDPLEADASGTRRFSLADLGIAIDSSGEITVSTTATTEPPHICVFPLPCGDDLTPRPVTPHPISISPRIDDPLAAITVIPTPPVALFWNRLRLSPSGSPLTPIPEPTPLPAVSVPAGVAPAGWAVSDAVWSPDGKYLAVKTHTSVASLTQLSVYSVQDHQLRELWREVDSDVDLDHNLAFRDINADGSPEVVYYTGTHSNAPTDDVTLALRIKDDGTVADVEFQLPISQSAPEQPIDLKGDGRFEWIAVDASWRYADTPFYHAISPMSQFVLAWNGHAYVDATARFADAIIHGADPAPPPAVTSCDDERTYVSKAVSRYLDYFNAGRTSDAQRILSDLSGARLDSPWSENRDAIVGALNRDPHAPKVVSAGDCPPGPTG